MRVFKCLSSNVSMMMDQDKKKRKAASGPGGRLRLNFKTKKRRPLTAISPNAGKTNSAANTMATLSPTTFDALRNLRLREKEDAPLSSIATPRSSYRSNPEAVKIRRRAMPLPAVPHQNGVSIYVKDLNCDDVDSDYVPLTHVTPAVLNSHGGNADSAASLNTLCSTGVVSVCSTETQNSKAAYANESPDGMDKIKSVKSLNEAFIQSTASLQAARLMSGSQFEPRSLGPITPSPQADPFIVPCPRSGREIAGTYSRQRHMGCRDWKRHSRHLSDRQNRTPTTHTNLGVAEMCQGTEFQPALTIHKFPSQLTQLNSTTSSHNTADCRSLLDSQGDMSSCDNSAWTTQSVSQDSPGLSPRFYENMSALKRSDCDGQSQTSADGSPAVDSPYSLYAHPQGRPSVTASSSQFEQSINNTAACNNTYISEIDDASIDYDDDDDDDDKENRMECVPPGRPQCQTPRSVSRKYVNVSTDTNNCDDGQVGHSSPDGSLNCRTSEFLGCMSFGVPHLLKKNVEGWYYLLTEDVGKQKHLKANIKGKPLISAKGVPSLGPINPATDGQERLIVTVAKGKHGFGFSFVGEMPPRVGRVDYGSPAEEAGVKRNDAIIRINGQNVSRSTCEGVAHLIKKRNPKYLTLELVRHHTPDTDSMASDPSDSRREMGTSTDHVYESIGDSPNASSDHHKENCGWRGSANQMEADRDMTDDEQISPVRGTSQATTSTPFPSKVASARTSCAQRKKQESIHRLMSLELEYIDFMRFGTERYSRPLRHCIITASQHSVLFQNVEKLLTISEYHIKQLEDSSASGSFHLNDSLPGGGGNASHSSPAFIYQPKIHMLCQAYETYAHGLKHSKAMLKSLRKNQDLMAFIHGPSADPLNSFQQPSISQFINRPIQHIHELYGVLRDLLSATSPHSPDYAVLQRVVAKLTECITAIINLGSDIVHNLESLTSSQGFSNSQASSAKGSLVSLVSCSSSEFDLDPKSLPGPRSSLASELAALQAMLVFPPDVPTFQLCNEDRHIIHKGDIFRCQHGLWFKSQVLLLSDLILVLDLEADGRLRVVQAPVYLSDLAGIEVNRKHASEFILHLHTTPTYSTLSQASCSTVSTKLVFRAPSVRDKLMWTSLVDKHVATVLGKKLKHYGSMQDISNIKTSVVL